MLCFLWLQEHLQLINLDAVSDFGIWLWTIHDFYCANNPFPVAGLGHLVENCLFISEKELPVSNHSRTHHKTDIPGGCFLISEMKVAVGKNGTLSLSEQVQSRSSLDVLTQLQEKKKDVDQVGLLRKWGEFSPQVVTVLCWHLPLSYVRSNPTLERLTVFYRTVLLGEPPNLTQHEGPLDIEDHTWTQNVIGFYFNFMTSWEGYTFLIWCFHHARKPCRFYFEMVCFCTVSLIFLQVEGISLLFPQW